MSAAAHLFIALASGLALASLPRAQIVLEPPEPNDAAAPAPIVPCGGEAHGRINFAGDSDLWSFQLAADSLVILTTTHRGLRAFPGPTRPGETGAFDTTLELYVTPALTPLWFDDDSGESLYEIIEVNLPAADALGPLTYFVRVGGDLTTIGDYALSLRCLPPDGLRTEPAEPNQTVADADRNGATLCDATYRCFLADPDTDLFRVDLAADTTIGFETRPGTMFDTVLTLFAADGTTVLASDDDGGVGRYSRIPPMPLTAAGSPYYLEVRSFSGVDTGSYLLDLDCRALPPPPVFVHASVAERIGALGCLNRLGRRAELRRRLNEMPVLGNPFGFDMTGLLTPAVPTVIAVGIDGVQVPTPLDAIGSPGCVLEVSQPLAFLTPPPANSNGNAPVSLLVPNDPGALGGPAFVLQALAIDPLAAPLGIVTSDTLRITLGERN